MITPFLLNNNIKNKKEFFSFIIDGHITCYNHDLSGQEMILFILYRKNFNMNYYECEITIRYSTDVFNYVCGMKVGNEKFTKTFLKEYEKKAGLLFNCSNNWDEKQFKKSFPHFNYIKYNGKDFNEKTIEAFINEQNKEIKKTQYYYTSKDPLTGKVSSKFRQQESSQNGSCILLFDNNETMINFIKYFNSILFTNYFSQYQKEKDFKKQNNDFIQLKKFEKIDYFYSEIKNSQIRFYEILKNFQHFDYKDYLCKKKR